MQTNKHNIQIQGANYTHRKEMGHLIRIHGASHVENNVRCFALGSSLKSTTIKDLLLAVKIQILDIGVASL